MPHSADVSQRLYLVAARKQLFHPDEVRQKIQASQLINRLTKHANSKQPIMDNSQVRAALGLLNKVVPDIRAVEISGTGENGGLVINVTKRGGD